MINKKRGHTNMHGTNSYTAQSSGRSAPTNRKQGGFTLIELSIVLVIIGFFMVGLIKAYELYQIEQIQREQDNKMDEMRRALAGYIQDEKCEGSPTPECQDEGAGGNDAVRYPCPANPDLGPKDPGYATEARSGGSCDTGNLVELTDGGTVAFKGAFPARTVGLSPEKMIDPYGNKYSYVVSKDMTQTDALKNTSSQGNLEIGTQSGGSYKSRFGLFSHGQKGEGAYTRTGHQISVSNSNSTEAENVDTDNVFELRQSQFRADNDLYYDDTFAASLVDDKDDEWWYAMDNAGQNLTHRNPGNIIMSNKAGSRVGIGTNSPENKLDVRGHVRVGSDRNVWHGGFSNDTPPSTQSHFQENSNSSGMGYLEVPWIYTNGCIEGDGKGPTATAICLGSKWNDGTKMNGFTEDDQITLVTRGEERVFVNEPGNVGIGTKTPKGKLHVQNGDTIFMGGFLGIGTTNPQTKLHVQDGNAAIMGGLLGIGTKNPKSEVHAEGDMQADHYFYNGAPGGGGGGPGGGGGGSTCDPSGLSCPDGQQMTGVSSSCTAQCEATNGGVDYKNCNVIEQNVGKGNSETISCSSGKVAVNKQCVRIGTEDGMDHCSWNAGEGIYVNPDEDNWGVRLRCCSKK